MEEIDQLNAEISKLKSNQSSKVLVKQPDISNNDDYFTDLIRVLEQQQIPDVKKILMDGVAKIETRTGLNVSAYINFGKKGNAQIKYHKDGNDNYIGELNAANKRHGRCIKI